ncbi:MAG TPA: TIGR03086 family metal-binding protein [Acidimicrobiales bacterium]|nr:TIGR03086 family metal-binding protein [Acidimicrobiales bacterium]
MDTASTPTAPSTAPAPIAAARLDPDDPRAVFARAVALGGLVVGGVGADQLAGPTGCPDLDVRTMLGHLVVVLRRVAAIGRGDDAMAVSAVVEGVSDVGWPAAWVETAHEVQSAWTDDRALSRTVHLPWATFPGSAALALYTGEVTLHTWDLATATGQRPAWNDQVVAVSLEALRQALPAEGRTAEFERVIRSMPAEAQATRVGGPPFAEAIEVPGGASPIDQLVAWSGRRP